MTSPGPGVRPESSGTVLTGADARAVPAISTSWAPATEVASVAKPSAGLTAERGELRRGQVNDVCGQPDVVQVAGGDLAVHRRVQQDRHGQEAQARDRDAQRARGQQRACAVPGQVAPRLAVQRVHDRPPVSPTIMPSRTDTIRDAIAASSRSYVT